MSTLSSGGNRWWDPKGKALADLHRLAMKNGLTHLAGIFNQALISELGTTAGLKLSDIEKEDLVMLLHEINNVEVPPRLYSCGNSRIS